MLFLFSDARVYHQAVTIHVTTIVNLAFIGSLSETPGFVELDASGTGFLNYPPIASLRGSSLFSIYALNPEELVYLDRILSKYWTEGSKKETTAGIPRALLQQLDQRIGYQSWPDLEFLSEPDRKLTFEVLLPKLITICGLACANAVLHLKVLHCFYGVTRIVEYVVPPYGVNVDEECGELRIFARQFTNQNGGQSYQCAVMEDVLDYIRLTSPPVPVMETPLQHVPNVIQAAVAVEPNSASIHLSSSETSHRLVMCLPVDPDPTSQGSVGEDDVELKKDSIYIWIMAVVIGLALLVICAYGMVILFG